MIVDEDFGPVLMMHSTLDAFSACNRTYVVRHLACCVIIMQSEPIIITFCSDHEWRFLVQ